MELLINNTSAGLLLHLTVFFGPSTEMWMAHEGVRNDLLPL